MDQLAPSSVAYPSPVARSRMHILVVEGLLAVYLFYLRRQQQRHQDQQQATLLPSPRLGPRWIESQRRRPRRDGYWTRGGRARRCGPVVDQDPDELHGAEFR